MKTYAALLHYPVYDKNRKVIATAVTNVDVHDLSRLCATYGMSGLFLVTPVELQRELLRGIIAHWTTGAGAKYNPRRKEAMRHARVADTLAEVMDEVRRETGVQPVTIGTTARSDKRPVTFERMKRILREQEGAAILLFGTGWGLEDSFLSACDFLLEPLVGRGEYNHLSVRSAAAIIIDRLLGGD